MYATPHEKQVAARAIHWSRRCATCSIVSAPTRAPTRSAKQIHGSTTSFAATANSPPAKQKALRLVAYVLRAL